MSNPSELSAVNPSGIAAVAAESTSVVARAAEILRREIAGEVGPVASPGGSLPADMLRGPAVETLQRLVHEWMAAFPIDALVKALVVNLVSLSAARMEPNSLRNPVMNGVGSTVPMLASAAPVSAGELATLVLRIGSTQSSVPVQMMSTDLVSEAGGRIPASNVAYPMNGWSTVGGGVRVVEIKVAVPNGSPAGTYSGLIQINGQPDARAVVSIRVT